MSDDDDSEEALRARVSRLENELRKAKRGMSNAAKKFRTQEQELSDAEKRVKEQKRTVKTLTARLRANSVAAPDSSDSAAAASVESIVDEKLVNFALSQVFTYVQSQLRKQDEASFKRIDSVAKFQSSVLQVVKHSLRGNSATLVDALREFANDRAATSTSSSDFGADSDPVDSPTSAPSTSNNASSSNSPVHNPDISTGATAARLTYFAAVEEQRRNQAKHVSVRLRGHYTDNPLKFTVTCTVPFLSTPGGSGRRGRTGASSLDAIPPVVRGVRDFRQFAEYLHSALPYLHLPACLVHVDSGIVRITGAAQHNPSAEKQARDAEYQLQLWLEYVMSHPLLRDLSALRDFLTTKGPFNASTAAQYNTSSVQYPPSVINSTISNSEADAARSSASSAADHLNTVVSRFAHFENQLRLASARQFGFARVLADASDCELNQTPKNFPHAPTWLQPRLATITGKTFGLVHKVQSSCGHQCAEQMYQLIESVAVPRVLFVANAVLPVASSTLSKDRRRSQALLQEWDHTRAQIFRGQAGEGLIPTLAVVARQRHDAAAEARSVWAECAARLRQIRRKVGFRVHDKNDAAGAPQADRRRRLQSIDISATQPWGAQTLGQVYAHRVVRTAYSWRQHAEYRVLVKAGVHSTGDGMLEDAHTSTWCVWRRFSAFSKLFDKLKSTFSPNKRSGANTDAYAAIPQLTNQKTLRRSLDPAFLQGRQELLNNFLQAVLSHPSLAKSSPCVEFLCDNQAHTAALNRAFSSMPQRPAAQASFRRRPAGSESDSVDQPTKSRHPRRSRSSSNHQSSSRRTSDAPPPSRKPPKPSGIPPTGRRRRSDPQPPQRARPNIKAAEPLLHRPTIPADSRRASKYAGLRGKKSKRKKKSRSERRDTSEVDAEHEGKGLKRVPTAPIVKDFWEHDAGPEDETGLKKHKLKSKDRSRKKKSKKDKRDKHGKRSRRNKEPKPRDEASVENSGASPASLMEEIRGGAPLKTSRRRATGKTSGKKYRRSAKAKPKAKPAPPPRRAHQSTPVSPPSPPKAEKKTPAPAPPVSDDDSAPSIDGDTSEDEGPTEHNRDRSETLGFGNAVNELFHGDGWIKTQSPDGRDYYYHQVTRKVSWEYPDERLRKATNELAHAILKKQAKAQKNLAKQRQESATEEKQAFAMDADLNKKLKTWRGKKNIVDVLNTLGDIIPECAPNFSVAARPSPAELRKARKRVFLKLHPDKIRTDAPLAQKLLAKKVFALINDLYNKLPANMK